MARPLARCAEGPATDRASTTEDGLVWHSALTPAPGRYANFVEEVVWGTRLDAHFKNLVRTGRQTGAKALVAATEQQELKAGAGSQLDETTTWEDVKTPCIVIAILNTTWLDVKTKWFDIA